MLFDKMTEVQDEDERGKLYNLTRLAGNFLVQDGWVVKRRVCEVQTCYCLAGNLKQPKK